MTTQDQEGKPEARKLPWYKRESVQQNLIRFYQLAYFFFVIFVVWSSKGDLAGLWKQKIPFGILILLSVLAIAATQAKTFGGAFSRLIDLFLHIWVSLGAGVAIVVATHPDAKTTMLEPKQLEEIVIAAIIIFTATIVGRAGTIMEETHSALIRDVNEYQTVGKQLKESTKNVGRLETIADRATRSVNEARFAGLAAKLLEVRVEALLLGGKGEHDVGIVEAVGGGIETLKAWISAGRRIHDPSSGLISIEREIARKAWWKMLQVYEKEEVYDIAQFQFATNVRNYCFMLLAVISQCLESIKGTPAPSREGREQGPYKLVLVNASGFAPKDYYNYPDGTKGSRFYHEAEFFGTYRRVLASVTCDERVLPIRVLLAAPPEKPTRTVAQGPSEGSLGWAFDPINKIVIDSARYHFIPLPVTDKTNTPGPAFLDGDFDDPDKPELKNEIGFFFRDKSDPASHLPPKVRRLLWAPTYLEFKSVRPDDYSLQVWWPRNRDSEEDAIQGALTPYFLQKTGDPPTRLHTAKSNRQKIVDIYLEPAAAGRQSFESRKSKAYGSLVEEIVRLSCEPQKRRDLKSAILKGLSVAPRDFHNSVDEKNFRELVKPESWDSAGKCLYALFLAGELENMLCKPLAGGRAPSDYCSALLEFVVQCQRIDSLLEVLGLERAGESDNVNRGTQGGFKKERVMSSTEVPLGPAEDWLHRSLVHHEAMRLKPALQAKGPLPLWRLIVSDLLGFRELVENSDRLAVEQWSILMDNFRIFVTGKGNEDGEGLTGTSVVNESYRVDTTERSMRQADLLGEFLMVGLVPEEKTKDKDWRPFEASERSGVKWIAMLGAELSEPFHTCKVQIHFDGCDDGRLDKHRQWLEEMWDKTLPNTKRFFEEVEREIERASF